MTVQHLTIGFARFTTAWPVPSVVSTGVAISIGSAGRLLFAIIVSLTLLATATQLAALGGRDHIFGLVALFDLNGEHNLPTWFSSLALLTAAVLLAGLAAADDAERRAGWRGLGLVFLYLSIDEAAGVHELLNRPLRAAFEVGPELYFPWVLVGAGVVAALAGRYWRFILALPPRTARLALLSAATFTTGALGLEIVAGPWYATEGKDNLVHVALVTAEEVLEMAGVALFICALTGYARERRLALALTFDGHRRAQPPGLVRFSARGIRSRLSLTIAAIGLTSLGAQVLVHTLGYGDAWGLARLVNVTREGNLPTWYQSTMLLACAALLAVIGRARTQSEDPFARHWIILAGLFLYISVDEAAAIHELTVRPLRSAFGLGGLLYYPWIALGAVVVTTLAISYRRFLWSQPREIRNGMLLAGMLYVAGAIGVEAISGWHAELFGRDNLRYAVLTTAEESLEMLGVLVLFGTLMAYVGTYIGTMTFNFATGVTASEPGGEPRQAVVGA
ncbi:MAG: hypothetical protein M3Q85_05505 [Acidobacteriota bacterium]|nr:hypothetical protein [Acidobacteriota bacterium]